jgi:predicted nucleic acid-binding Zn finger protein
MEKHNMESTIKTYLNKLNAETNRALTAEVKKKKWNGVIEGGFCSCTISITKEFLKGWFFE